MSKKAIIITIIILALLVLGAVLQLCQKARIKGEFSDDFSGESTLEEAGKSVDSEDQNWWLSAGAYFLRADGVGQTNQGELEEDSPWQIKYANNDPGETDDGFHPQNIFRLVTRSRWQNYTQQVYFRIQRINQSADSHRSASNGLLLFNRYQDDNDLYYTGIRVDGEAVVKKKYHGAYYTMAHHPVFTGTYDRDTKPNLLPLGSWIGIRSEVTDRGSGKVGIRLYVDRERSGNWQLVLEAEDDGRSYGGASIRSEGYAGMRTDFMDVEFDDYSIAERG